MPKQKTEFDFFGGLLGRAIKKKKGRQRKLDEAERKSKGKKKKNG